MNKTIRVAIGAMAICGSALLLGSELVNATDGSTDLLNLIPDVVTLSVNESEYIKGGEGEQIFRFGNTVNTLVENKVKDALTTGGATFGSVTVSCGNIAWGGSFYACDVSLSGANSKSITLKYANTSDTNAAVKAALQAKIDAVADNGIIRTEHLYPDGVTVDFIISEQDKFVSEAEKFVQSIIGGSDYTIYVDRIPVGADGQGVPRFISPVFIYRGDELYAVTKMMPQYNTYSNATTTKTEITKDDSVYTELATKLETKGYKVILGAYELETSGNSSRFFLSFDIDNRYNGKTVVVLHKIADGNYEEFERTVKDGKVEIETSSLSPFMIALKETVAGAGNNASTNTNTSSTAASVATAKPNSPSAPDTGVATESDGSRATSAMLGSIIFGVAGCMAAALFTAKKIIVRKKEQQA